MVLLWYSVDTRDDTNSLWRLVLGLFLVLAVRSSLVEISLAICECQCIVLCTRIAFWARRTEIAIEIVQY